jgi:hypothetical protein
VEEIFNSASGLQKLQSVEEITFSGKEESKLIFSGKITQLMEHLDVFISVKPKPKQPSKVCIRYIILYHFTLHSLISLTYLERQKMYGLDKKILFKKQLFDLEVKGQGPTKVIMVCDTQPYGHAPVRTITFLSFQIGQLFLVCGCMTIRLCVAYHNDLRGTLTFDLKFNTNKYI